MDEVIGIAILTRTVPQELLVMCRAEPRPGNAAGKVFLETIPAYAVGANKPAEHAWQYQIVGDVLNITPSLHCRYQLPQEPGAEPRPGSEAQWITRFHNGYNWSVKFQWANGVNPDEVRREAHAANPDIKITCG